MKIIANNISAVQYLMLIITLQYNFLRAQAFQTYTVLFRNINLRNKPKNP